MDNNLVDSMKVVLADSYAFALKSQNFHWNVQGPNFSEYHTFFAGLYDELFVAIDAIAEHIRTLDAFAPGSFKRFAELSTIEDELNVPSANVMMQRLNADNLKLIKSLQSAFEAAEEQKEVGLSNFLQDRIDIHKKHGWMLKSFVTRDIP